MTKLSVQKKLSKTGRIFIRIICFTIVGILLYMPIIVIALQSFNNSKNTEIFNEFSLKWYGELFSPNALDGRDLQNAIKNTLIVTLLSTTISTILGTIFAIGINALSKKRRQKMIMINNVPIVNADIVTGITLMIVFTLIFGELGFGTILLAHIFFSLPYVVLSVLPKLSEINDNLYDAAVDLGCSPFKAILKVIIPAIKSGIFMGMLLAFTMSIDDFTISYFTGARLGSLNNVSMMVYLRKGKTLSPAVYSYNTLLTCGTFLILLLYNVRTMIKKNRMTKHKKHTV